MDIVYAAEKPSIAKLLAEHISRDVEPDEIKVTENPNETGSFYIGWRLKRYVLSPSGAIASESRTASRLRSARAESHRERMRSRAASLRPSK